MVVVEDWDLMSEREKSDGGDEGGDETVIVID